MRQKTSFRVLGRRGFRSLTLAAIAAVIALGAAPAARANNDFKNGFEDQLGRIAAFGAVNLGLHVLSGGYYPPVPVAVAPVAAPAYYGPAYYGPAYAPAYAPYYGPRTVVVKYPKHYYSGAYCDAHGGYDGRGYRGWQGDHGRGKPYRGGHGRGW